MIYLKKISKISEKYLKTEESLNKYIWWEVIWEKLMFRMLWNTLKDELCYLRNESVSMKVFLLNMHKARILFDLGKPVHHLWMGRWKYRKHNICLCFNGGHCFTLPQSIRTSWLLQKQLMVQEVITVFDQMVNQSLDYLPC